MQRPTRYAYKDDREYKDILNKLIKGYIADKLNKQQKTFTDANIQEVKDTLYGGQASKSGIINPSDDLVMLEDNAKRMYDNTKIAPIRKLKITETQKPSVFSRGFQSVLKAGRGVISAMRQRQDMRRNPKIGIEEFSNVGGL